MKNMLYGTADQEPQTEVTAQLAQEMYNNNMLHLLIQNLAKIDFEVCSVVRKTSTVLENVRPGCLPNLESLEFYL